MIIERLFISPAHNYFGHHGQPAGTAEAVSLTEVELVAGKGICGDRFFDYKEDYKGQITFFTRENYERLCSELSVDPAAKGPEVFRRNVIVSGIDLNTLIGKPFTVQGIDFLGVCECTPCYWMDQAFAPGAEAALKGNGGLRARILTSGVLRVDEK